jgi:polyhydroxybutyrate depolymerase
MDGGEAGASGSVGTAGSSAGSSTGGRGGQGGAGGSGGKTGGAGAGGGGTTGKGGSGGSSAATCPATATLTPGDTKEKITVGSDQRSYLLHVPQSYTGKVAVPLVLEYHGYGGDGAQAQSYSGLNAQSDKDGFIIASLDAIGGCWNPGTPGLSCGNDDVAFTKAVVKKLSGQGCIDPKRIYLNGFSQGGGMVYRLSCEAADLFAAAVTAGFDLWEGLDCRPSRPISVLAFRGTADRYDGGNGLIGAVKTQEKWKELDGCTGGTTDWMGCQVYQTCKESTEVGLCTIKDGGHGYGPGETGWAFMKRQSQP